MKTTKKSTFSLMFYIKKTKLLKNGEAPICLRITVNCHYAEIMIKRSLPVNLWDQKKENSKGKAYSDKELNHYLDSVKARVYLLQRELETEGRQVTAIAIRDRYNGKDEGSKTLVQIYEDHNRQCRKLIGIDYTESTVDKFDTSLSHLKEFMKHDYRREDIPLFEVDNQFVRDFEVYLKVVRGCQHNSSLKHLKNLKKVISIAQANGWIKKDPFYGIRFSYEDTGIDFLTREELEIITNKEFTIPRLAQVRDIFVFCCFTALAFIDVKQLSKEHIIKDNEGNLWINKDRQKTGVMCNIPLLPIAEQILKKYESHPGCIKDGVLLPVLSNQKMNSYLKEIADLCGIEKKLSTHLARHTAATVVFLANQVTIENVARILGHRKLQMTQHYAKVLDSSIMRDMSAVKNSFAAMMSNNEIIAKQPQ